MCVTWHTSPVKTWKDFLEKPVTLGGTGPSGELDIFTNLYKNVFNANVKLVSGYPGTAEIMLAMERGELDGVCGIDWTTLKAQRARWIAEKKINVIAQAAFRKDPDLPNVPLIMELTSDPEKLQILKLFVSAHEFARPYAAPPGIPADRAAALIAAFDATTKDPDFLAETAKHQMEVAPVSGKKLADMLAELYTTPESVLAKARAAIAREIALQMTMRPSRGDNFMIRSSATLRPIPAASPRMPSRSRRPPARRASSSSMPARPSASRSGSRPAAATTLYARLLARHMGKHIPGQPKIVPQNMPGAGSLRAAQSSYSAAPKDGTAIATFGRQMGITPLLTPNANYDGTKLGWLGSITNEVSNCVSWHTAAVKTWDDLLVKPITFGGDGPGADPDVFALLYKNVFNADQAGERLSRHDADRPGDGARRGRRVLRLFVEHDQEQAPGLAQGKEDEHAGAGRAEEGRRSFPTCRWRSTWPRPTSSGQILKLFLTSQETARPFTAPPGIPADRAGALRRPSTPP